MKRFLFLVFMLLVFISNTAFTDEYYFKNTRWGMTIEDVKASEDAILYLEYRNGLIYNDFLFENEFTVDYTFIENKLASVDLSPTKPSDNSYKTLDSLRLYLVIKQSLLKKHGKPKTDEIAWLDKRFQNKIHINQALQFGLVSLKSLWEEKLTAIEIILMNPDYYHPLTVRYKHKNLYKIIEQHEEKWAKGRESEQRAKYFIITTLENIAMAQTIYWIKKRRNTSKLQDLIALEEEALKLRIPNGIQVEITHADKDSWAGFALHQNYPESKCLYDSAEGGLQGSCKSWSD